MARKSSVTERGHDWSTLAAREHLESGGRLTNLEAVVMFGMKNIARLASEYRKEGVRVGKATIPYARALRRLNKYAQVEPPKELPIRDLTLIEYWLDE